MHQHERLPDWDTLPPLSDEAAAQILQFLYQWAAQFESHYYGQLCRYYEESTPDDQIELFPETDPPF